MDGGPPCEPEDLSSPRPAGRRGAYTAAAGVIVGVLVGIAAIICLAVGAVSAQQAIAMGVPAVLLIIGGLVIAAVPDPATGRRAAFEAGFRAGWVLTRWRSLFGQHRNGS